MDGDFFVGAALATTLTKLALRYISLTDTPRSQNVRKIHASYLKEIGLLWE